MEEAPCAVQNPQPEILAPLTFVTPQVGLVIGMVGMVGLQSERKQQVGLSCG